MAYGTPREIVNMLVWEMNLDEASSYLRNLPPEVKTGVMNELSSAASCISKIEGRFYEKNGVPLALHADVDQ